MSKISPTNAFFVCKECGRLTAILSPLWHEQNNDPNLRSSQIASKIFEKPVLLPTDKSISFSHIDEIKEITQYFGQYDIPFPLCNECLLLWGRNLIQQFNFLQATNLEYHFLNIPDKNGLSRNTRAKINQLTKSIQIYEDTSADFKQKSLTTNLKSCSSSYFPFSQSQDNIFSPSKPICPNTLIHLKKPLPKEQADNFLRHPALLNCVVFHIHFHHFWGLINSCRIGITIGENEISVNECNTAFFFLSHLILSLSPIFKMEIPNLKLQNPVVIIAENGQNFYLNAEYLYSKWRIKNFNNAIHEFMKICFSLFRNRELNTDHLAPPFHIDLQKKTISGESYIYSRNNSEGWTRAMKSLLENFKFLQTWANSNTVYSLSQHIEQNLQPKNEN